jgi:hypothetical protein
VGVGGEREMLKSWERECVGVGVGGERKAENRKLKG